ncbi:Aldehyde oxidoreductase FAD-binding subunit PaoB [Geodia barretti]|uniref:Aldehyde oxidoreductase FAD-binding subunit PaoB n=1 Tax=Geodia barretti TaxID=519541 RepID=A0AA35WC14_GEOBA|nr:Aldehyde oxidoreductase FAD-binding subunit PaoB [Geodia barretti]
MLHRASIRHPVALSALDAQLEIAGPNGRRELPIGEFFAGPGRDLLRENVLEPGELITRISLSADAPERSVYLKVRERESGDFALVSVATALTLDGDGTISKARVALGGVAPVPYRAVEVEAYLVGRRANDVDPSEAAALALPNATPLPQNGYKIRMANNIVRRVLSQLLDHE